MKKVTLVTFASFFSLAIIAQQYPGKDHHSPQQKLNDEYCTGIFNTADGTIIDLVNDNISATGYRNIIEWLPGRVAGLQLYHTRFGTAVPFLRNARASIFVDELPVDAGFMESLPVAGIAIIKIIRQPFAGAIGNGGGGVIAIYTIKGENTEDEGDGDR
jgi:hypothetical protein